MRQNKEKVSRRIERDKGIWQRKNETLQRNLKHIFLSRCWDNKISQRKVGFEFQTIGSEWNVLKKNGNQYTDPEHAESIKDHNGIKIETDGVDLEFVTHPIDENNNDEIKELAESVDNILSKFLSTLEGGQINITYKGKQYSNCKELGEYCINLDGNQTAHPQATVGVKMENIIDLLDKITNAPIQDGGPIFGHTTYFTHNVPSPTGVPNHAYSQRQAVIDSVKNAKAYTTISYKVQGIIALIEHFIKVNKDAIPYDKKKNYNANAKNKMPVMPRTSLKELYNVLSKDEKTKIIRYLDSKPQDTVVMYQDAQYSGSDSQGKPIFEYPKEGNRYLIADLRKDLLGSQDIFTKRAYSSIGEGIIITDENGNPIKNLQFEEESFSSQISNVKKAIFELRSLPNLVSQDQWGNVVRVVAKLIKDVNSVSHVKEANSRSTLPSLRQPRSVNQQNASISNRQNTRLPNLPSLYNRRTTNHP